jgi:RNA polymerase sigma-70 factor (ECF subfamily)
MKFSATLATPWLPLPEVEPAPRQRSPNADRQVDNEVLAALIVRARVGEERAWRDLITLYQNRIAGFVYAIVGRGHMVEDLTQQIFVKLVRSLGQLQSSSMFEPWLFRMARNTCFDHLRRQKLRRIFLPLGPEHYEHAETPGAVSSEELDTLTYALQHLRPKDRAVVALVQEGRSHAEIAEMFSTTVSAVKSRLHRARVCIIEHYQFGRTQPSLTAAQKRRSARRD